MRLQDKVAVITGGAGGIGLATAELFLKEGAKGVFLVDIDENNLKNAAKKLHEDDKVGFEAADVSRTNDVKRYTEKAIERFGKIDILFLNAGLEGVVKPFEEYPEEMYDKVMGVNMKGVWLGIKYAFPNMKEHGGGSVIITSSVAGMMGTPTVSAYVASKHGVNGLMKVAALEGAASKIRVNSIHPSPVDNRMMRSLEEGFAPGAGADAKKGFEEIIPLGRYADNDDIANLALFLASDESAFITGSQYAIDGGMTA